MAKLAKIIRGDTTSTVMEIAVLHGDIRIYAEESNNNSCDKLFSKEREDITNTLESMQLFGGL